MPQLIDAWRKDTGEKLAHPIPATWIRDGVNLNLTDVPPSSAVPQPGQPAQASIPDPTIPQEA
jgi:hypothetical protein